jgi:ribosome recycling factor
MTIAEIKKTATEKMAKSVETLKNDLGKVRTGRAHTGILDHLRVDYYGTEMPINQVANVTLSDARTISIQPFEKKMVQVVEKAIRDSDLGVNPATSGDVIRVPMPSLTEERRKEMAKLVKHEGENAKVAIRNIRRDAMAHVKALLKESEISEDDDKRAEKEIQALTDKSIADIDRLVAEKERDLMAV